MMRKVKLEDSIGLPLGHDITEILVDKQVKHAAFRRGHIVTGADLDKLRNLGKNYLYIHEESDTEVHEDEVHEDAAAITIAPLAAGTNITFEDQPTEGKIRFKSTCDGLFTVDIERLYQINSLEIPSLPTLPSAFPVTSGQTVAAFRIVPLTCEQQIVDKVINILDKPLFGVKPYVLKTAAIIVTGNEVYEGRIKDGFIPLLTAKLEKFGVKTTHQLVLPDDDQQITQAVAQCASKADLVLVTGGTSVDPDDVTVQAMTAAGVKQLVKGMALQPGNNFTIGYLESTPVCAVPAAALFFKATALDVFLPRLAAGQTITREEIYRMGHGGLCLQCSKCTFPICTFGGGGNG